MRTGVRVTGVERDGDGVRVLLADGGLERADACVLTTPFAAAAELYPTLKESGSELLSATGYTGCYTLRLLYDGRPPAAREPYVVMVPKSASSEVAAVFLEQVKGPDRGPAGQGQVVVYFNLADGPPDGPDLSTWADEDMHRVGRAFVEELFPELAGGLRAWDVTRWDYAAHKGNVGYYAALEKFLRGYPAADPVQVAGDWMAVAGQESAVLAGVRAAARVVARVSG